MSSASSYPRRISRAVIPAAGRGTRLLPLTKAVPKELMPLGRKPVLEHILEEVAKAGIAEALFVISADKTAIRAHFGDNACGVNCSYVFQQEMKGLADAIYCGRDWVGSEPFAVVLGDSVISTSEPVMPFSRVLQAYHQTSAAAVIVVQKTAPEELSRYGIVKPVDQIAPSFQIDDLVEKPALDAAPSEYAIAGRYAFDPIIFDYIERTPRGANGEYQITDSIKLMLRDSHEVWCVALQDGEIRRDIGTFESYFDALRVYFDQP